MPIISWQKTMIIKTFIKDKQKREIYGFPKMTLREKNISLRITNYMNLED